MDLKNEVKIHTQKKKKKIKIIGILYRYITIFLYNILQFS